jgi:hypothetical protein
MRGETTMATETWSHKVCAALLREAGEELRAQNAPLDECLGDYWIALMQDGHTPVIAAEIAADAWRRERRECYHSRLPADPIDD